ncbi:hypothetical protein SISNIDRAFT_454916 [Sistotremastrum niveocremeum HHB9708]|uniref:Uncharacterized protein n=2 Tax=Sistotremastraceae TaxID=3402574 RepID=A0A164U6R1_9AGAM|nr:hypothetical protein SISNIDRAFT_454916 [Sistotremastrum niveocremeum HHB9708]KZT44360.1 hypothetical protein SISSUDRAFT_1038862 [Sistotremastrum suecicum HHB10207 ss-3]
MSATKFASFAQYTPPPDEPQTQQTASTSRGPIKPWFPSQSSSYGAGLSYQSGGLPTLGASASGGAGSIEEDTPANQWETRFGWRVDVLAAVAYLGGPITALALLIFETTNDFVRFHAYQSALSTSPAVALVVLCSLLRFASWFVGLLTTALILGVLFLALRAYRDASLGGLSRYRLPWVGELADRWVGEE